MTIGSEFSAAYDRAFFLGVGEQIPIVYRLDLTWCVDDHPRSHHPMWRHFGLPKTQVGLYLFREPAPRGTVYQTTWWDINEIAVADDSIAGGHEWYGAANSWQVAVLRAHNYPLVAVDWVNAPFQPPPDAGPNPPPTDHAYGLGPYGVGDYGG